MLAEPLKILIPGGKHSTYVRTLHGQILVNTYLHWQYYVQYCTVKLYGQLSHSGTAVRGDNSLFPRGFQPSYIGPTLSVFVLGSVVLSQSALRIPPSRGSEAIHWCN